MKSKYEFLDLKKEYIVAPGDDEDIFFRMLSIAEHGSLNLVTDHISEINNSIPDGKYWIAQNIESRKGKKRFFLGRVACAFKDEIIDFIERSIKKDDLRNLIIQPIFECDWKFVVLVSEEGSFFLYQNVPSKRPISDMVTL